MAHVHSTHLNVAGTPYQDSAMQLLIAELTDKGLEMMEQKTQPHLHCWNNANCRRRKIMSFEIFPFTS